MPRQMPISVLPKYLSLRLGVPSSSIEMLHKGASLPQARTVSPQTCGDCLRCQGLSSPGFSIFAGTSIETTMICSAASRRFSMLCLGVTYTVAHLISVPTEWCKLPSVESVPGLRQKCSGVTLLAIVLPTELSIDRCKTGHCQAPCDLVVQRITAFCREGADSTYWNAAHCPDDCFMPRHSRAARVAVQALTWDHRKDLKQAGF